jgi:predicted metal-dependent HD superfamily phosphohydrolase
MTTHNKLTMRKVTMTIKKIKITSHGRRAVRDTTIGKVYDVTFHSRGSIDACGYLCQHDSLCFRDDVGDKVAIWTHDPVYVVIEVSPND